MGVAVLAMVVRAVLSRPGEDEPWYSAETFTTWDSDVFDGLTESDALSWARLSRLRIHDGTQHCREAVEYSCKVHAAGCVSEQYRENDGLITVRFRECWYRRRKVSGPPVALIYIPVTCRPLEVWPCEAGDAQDPHQRTFEMTEQISLTR